MLLCLHLHNREDDAKKFPAALSEWIQEGRQAFVSAAAAKSEVLWKCLLGGGEGKEASKCSVKE